MSRDLVLALAVLAALTVYAAACRWWPYAACRRCSGEGKLRSPSGRAWRKCPRCKGSGARLRIGRRILNYWTENTRNIRG